MNKDFKKYSAEFRIGCDPTDLDICLMDTEYGLFSGDGLVKTPGGNPFSHPAEGVIRQILTDLQVAVPEQPAALSSPVLFAFCRDHVRKGSDTLSGGMEALLGSDPFIRIKTSGNPAITPFGPEDPLFALAFNTVTGLTQVVNQFAARVMSEVILEEGGGHPFIPLIRMSYERLDADHKTVVQALGAIHGSGIVMPLLLVTGEISPVDYSKGLLSLRMQTRESYAEILAGAAMAHTYLDSIRQKAHQDKPASLLIPEGEGDSLEFKSTLRWDIRAGKTNPAIERSCLKTISAFLNSKGGTLLIGVRDDGTIEGIESDKFANEDKFLLHLWTLVRICLGRDFSPCIRTRLEKTGDKTVCIVDCTPSSRPVFLRQPGFPEEMYIRVGPSSNALDISEALKYINERFLT